MTRFFQSPQRLIKTSSAGGSEKITVISPMRTVSKRAQRKAAQAAEEGKGDMNSEPIIINNGKKDKKGQRHKRSSSLSSDDEGIVRHRSAAGERKHRDALLKQALLNAKEAALDRIDHAVDSYAVRVHQINQQSKMRPTSSHLDADDEYGHRKASGAMNYHRDATLSVDGQLKSKHLVREVNDTLSFGLKRIARAWKRSGEEGVIHRLNEIADQLDPSTIQHDVAHTVYSDGHHTDKQKRHILHSTPHGSRRAQTRGLLAKGEVHGAEGIPQRGSTTPDDSLKFISNPHHQADLDLSY